MPTPLSTEIRSWIRDWQRRNNSGVGTRRKAAETAASTNAFILTQVAAGGYATDHIVSLVRLSGFPTVTETDVIAVANEMLQVPA